MLKIILLHYRKNKRLYELDSEITKIIGLLPRIIMTLMKGEGKKYAQDQLNKFKVFPEGMKYDKANVQVLTTRVNSL